MRGPPRVLLCALLWFLSPAAPALSVVDDRGQAISLGQSAGRIVSLAPHVTELLFAAGAGDRVVAVVEYSDWPSEARALPRVGNSGRVDLERIVALAPDLVIGWQSGNNSGDIAALERLGIPVFVTEIGTLAAIPRALEELGALAGAAGSANAAAARFRAGLAALTRRFDERTPVRLFWQIWERPLMTVNDRHFISDSIRLCGGVNVFGDIDAIAPSVSIEAVLAADPEAIITSASDERHEEQLAAWRRWKSLDAVRRDNLYWIPSDLIARPTPRILAGVERLCELLDLARTRNLPGSE